MDPGPASLKCSARPVTWRELSGYALKHLVDEGKISSYSERPPDGLLRESSAARCGNCDQRGHGNDWVAFQKNRF
jgi:hypothetical protein